MKTKIRLAMLFLLLGAFLCTPFAQSGSMGKTGPTGTTGTSGKKTKTTMKTMTKTTTKTTTTKKPAGPVSNKQVTVSVKNLCEKSISLFAGSKDDIKSPNSKMKTLGGLSQNKVYVKVTDVICIMNAQLKPQACTDVKATTTAVEINSAGNGITGK